MGDTVNLAARLMGKAQINEINCDLYVFTVNVCRVAEWQSRH